MIFFIQINITTNNKILLKNINNFLINIKRLLNKFFFYIGDHFLF